jgi:hypothetical protein
MNHDRSSQERSSPPTIVLGMGTGRCGTHTLAELLNAQQDAVVTHEQPPLLVWSARDARTAIAARIGRIKRTRAQRLIGDVASFYLPYVDAAIALEPSIRVVVLERPREEVVESFVRWLDRVHALPLNHWAAEPAPGWHHDPVWSRIFPKYPIADREEAIRRYWDEYHETATTLAKRFPENVRIFPMHETLNTDTGVADLLSFVGIPPESRVIPESRHRGRVEQFHVHPRRAVVAGTDASHPSRCAVLVPFATHIVPACETALRELERRGYAVWRVAGYAAIDQGRNQMATDALVQGFEETMWIDADIAFDPDAVDKLRAHAAPVVCGIYSQKGRRAVACHVMPGTPSLTFGTSGGLVEILYAAAGFLLVRRPVYMDMIRQLDLSVTNEAFGRPMIPFFQPLVRQVDEGSWYLAEDYAFCERARHCGYRIYADTTIRLWHIGSYSYGWEDAGSTTDRYGTFHLKLD